MANSHPKGGPASFRPCELYTKDKGTFEKMTLLTPKRHKVFTPRQSLKEKGSLQDNPVDKDLSRFLLALLFSRHIRFRCFFPPSMWRSTVEDGGRGSPRVLLLHVDGSATLRRRRFVLFRAVWCDLQHRNGLVPPETEARCPPLCDMAFAKTPE